MTKTGGAYDRYGVNPCLDLQSERFLMTGVRFVPGSSGVHQGDEHSGLE